MREKRRRRRTTRRTRRARRKGRRRIMVFWTTLNESVRGRRGFREAEAGAGVPGRMSSPCAALRKEDRPEILN